MQEINDIKTETPNWWATVREAVHGSQQDFTEGSIGRAIFLLSVPMVLEMMMESLFGLVNVYWVAHLGKEQAAAVGITEALLTIVFTVAMGLSMATTATVARRIGEKDEEGAGHAAMQAILLGVLCSIPIGLVGALFAPQLFKLMNAEPSVTAMGTGYLRIIFGGNLVVMLIFLINAIFRGAGDAAIAMRALWIGNAINLVLDPCLIFGWGPFPELGVTGSAIATTIGRGVAVCYQLWRLFGGTSRVPVRKAQFLPDWSVMQNLLKMSLGGMLQMLLATAAWMFMMSLVGRFGSAAQAGYTIAIRILIVAILPSWGMSNAGATLVGQNLGANKPERAEKSVWLAGHSNAVFLAIITLACVLGAEWMVRLFTDDAEVIHHASNALRYISYGYVFYGYGMVMASAFNGAGDTWTPTKLNIICFWLIQIPLAWMLSQWTGWNELGVFFAITFSESILAVLAMIYFKQGKWKTTQV